MSLATAISSGRRSHAKAAKTAKNSHTRPGNQPKPEAPSDVTGDVRQPLRRRNSRTGILFPAPLNAEPGLVKMPWIQGSGARPRRTRYGVGRECGPCVTVLSRPAAPRTQPHGRTSDNLPAKPLRRNSRDGYTTASRDALVDWTTDGATELGDDRPMPATGTERRKKYGAVNAGK